MEGIDFIESLKKLGKRAKNIVFYNAKNDVRNSLISNIITIQTACTILK